MLEDIDDLFTAMVTASNINPTFLGNPHKLKPAMREWHAKDNDHPMANVFRVDPPAEHWIKRLLHRWKRGKKYSNQA